ncbi:MAG: haloacid dehalogenase, partial [Actinomycetota bacterium]|nr:haloacid dehalogenase [Actinomycetota bacterium]
MRLVAATQGTLRRVLSTRTRGLAVFVAALAAAAALPPGAASAPSGSPCPGRDGAGWTLSSTTFDQNYSHHGYVGNGYLSQRVPATGMGYLSTGEKTGWPLYTPRYDG